MDLFYLIEFKKLFATSLVGMLLSIFTFWSLFRLVMWLKTRPKRIYILLTLLPIISCFSNSYAQEIKRLEKAKSEHVAEESGNFINRNDLD